MSERIYHLAPLSELRAGTGAEAYAPARLADDGFVHCAVGRETVLAVAADYFGDLAEPLMLLEIDPRRLRARCVFEAPAPLAGGGRAHLATASQFPHVYGPIDRAAIVGVAALGVAGDYRWPPRFDPLDV